MTDDEIIRLDALTRTVGAAVHLLRGELPALDELLADQPSRDSERRAALAVVRPIFKKCYRHIPTGWRISPHGRRRAASNTGAEMAPPKIWSASIPAAVWNRDIRAGGITEGRRSGAEIGDASKAAGHTKVQTTARVYDRDVLDATRRVQRKRIAARDTEAE